MLMLASNNILKLADGEPIVTPTQDVILGCYSMTQILPGMKGEKSIFASPEEAILAYQTGALDIQAEIQVRFTKVVDGKTYSKRLTTSVGRIIFSQSMPQGLLLDRTKEENYCELECNKIITKNDLKNIIALAYNNLGTTECSILIDTIKDLGYKYSTLVANTINAFDGHEPESKKKYVTEAEAKVLENEKLFKRGLITNDEKVDANVDIWNEVQNKIDKETLDSLKDGNPLKTIIISGARGNAHHLATLCGMVGLKTAASGQKIDIPVKSNFIQGLQPVEHFLSARGARKGLMDTALKTADSGYLTRRLVDISQDVVVTTEDCFADNGEAIKGMWVSDLYQGGNIQETLAERIYGRVAVDDVVDPKTGEVIVKSNEMISKEQAAQIEKAGIKRVQIRTLLTCKCRHGVCAKCYGRDLSGKAQVTVGEAVGVIAAQSIGEPGTQLTMRTFHSGGSASAADITQGLPRVEEIFEARRPKGECVLSEVAGKVNIKQDAKYYIITVQSKDGDTEYEIKKPAILSVKNGDSVEPGSQLTQGPINPSELLRLRGLKGLQDYLLSEVIGAYRSQGVGVNDKHVEIIVHQMLKKVKIESSGDTNLLPGEIVDLYRCEDENNRVLAEGGVPATAKRILLGITKAALSTESFLSAASFQETSRVLTDAALKGKQDNLLGIKENVIIGKLIPAGTGLKKYREVMPVVVKEDSAV